MGKFPCGLLREPLLEEDNPGRLDDTDRDLVGREVSFSVAIGFMGKGDDSDDKSASDARFNLFCIDAGVMAAFGCDCRRNPQDKDRAGDLHEE